MKRKKRKLTKDEILDLEYIEILNADTREAERNKRQARARLKAIPAKASKSRTFNIFGLKIPF